MWAILMFRYRRALIEFQETHHFGPFSTSPGADPRVCLLCPADSDAALSYPHRILNGTSLTVERLIHDSGTDEKIV